ncbi:hypothetical protein RHGRI_008373 [Rhododendron griersonianum]|uniref:Heat shock protein 70 n=1 Tax=Rhododendron griersonianum TaxID=479676 RepID=A0AAV6L267_9ERIC|nr:hypothetical protein RHGRI_008373 [Rhododendron griersonianum]
MAGEGQGPVIGIDLGTTYSCVAVWQHNRIEIIANDQGNRTTPSYVAFTDTERLTGDAAKNQVAVNATNTVFGYSFVGVLKTSGVVERDGERAKGYVVDFLLVSLHAISRDPEAYPSCIYAQIDAEDEDGDQSVPQIQNTIELLSYQSNFKSMVNDSRMLKRWKVTITVAILKLCDPLAVPCSLISMIFYLLTQSSRRMTIAVASVASLSVYYLGF